MERSEIESKVVNVLRGILKKGDIPLDMPLLGKPGIMDSVTVVQLIRQIEKDFGIRFDDDDLDLDSLASVRSVVDLIMSCRERV
jgi:acyl carrier protein